MFCLLISKLLVKLLSKDPFFISEHSGVLEECEGLMSVCRSIRCFFFFLNAKLYWPLAFLYSARINEALLSFIPSIPQINNVNTSRNLVKSLCRHSLFSFCASL